jgi:hypothetical protein
MRVQRGGGNKISSFTRANTDLYRYCVRMATKLERFSSFNQHNCGNAQKRELGWRPFTILSIVILLFITEILNHTVSLTLLGRAFRELPGS